MGTVIKSSEARQKNTETGDRWPCDAPWFLQRLSPRATRRTHERPHGLVAPVPARTKGVRG